MYEPITSTDLKFLLPGDSLTVFSHKSFPEQFEFVLHYVDKASGEWKSVIAPHQSRLRAFLSISRPAASSASRNGGSLYHQVTFSAPATGKNTFSGFGGSFYKKAGLLELLAEQERLDTTTTTNVDFSFGSAPLSSSQSNNALKRNTSAPTTPAGGSPRNLASPAASSDEVKSNTAFLSSALLTSSFSSGSLTALSAAAQKAAGAKRLIPVAISFRTRVVSAGKESIHSSPLFVICDNIHQVDLLLCRTIKKYIPETYPLPGTAINAELPPKPVSKKSTRTDAKKEKVEKVEKTEKVEKVAEKPLDKAAEKAEKKAAEKAEKKAEKKAKRDSSSRSKSPSPKDDSETSSASASILPARCNTEAPVVETSRFHGLLKFW